MKIANFQLCDDYSHIYNIISYLFVQKYIINIFEIFDIIVLKHMYVEINH